MSKLKVTTIANVADSESTDVTNVINGSAKAWVNFNGTGTVAIRQGFNVSSVTDNGTGDYTVNFTNAMADANYVINGSVADVSSYRRTFNQSGSTAPTTSAVRVVCKDAASGTTTANVDNAYMQVSIFR